MVDTGAAAVAEAEASMVEVVIMEGIPEDIEVDTPVDSMAGILVVDTVLLLHLEDTMEGIMLLLYHVDTLVDTEVGTTVGIKEDTMAVIEVGTIEGTMAGVIPGVITGAITHIGDYGDGDIGDGLFWDGLFWDGPMLVGPTMAIVDTRI